MNDPNRPDAPEIAKSNGNPVEKESNNARFRYLLINDKIEIPNEYYVDCYERKMDVRDIYTYIVFEDDGTLVFRVIDDACRYGDNFGSKRFYDITIYIIEAARREEVFNVFSLPATLNEAERRDSLAAALRVTFKSTGAESLLKSNGIVYESEYNAIYV